MAQQEKEAITLFDMETNSEINPSFYMIKDNNSVIKLVNCKSKKIKLNLLVTKESNISGIVIKENKLFLR